MKKPPLWARTAQLFECDECGKPVIIKTAPEVDPEAKLLAYVECECGEWVEVELPVNL